MKPAAAPGGRWIAVAGGAAGAVTVVLAALGSHAVSFEGENALRLWNTAVALLGFHALALLAVAALRGLWRSRLLDLAALAMMTGSLLFCCPLLLRAGGATDRLAGLPPVGGMMMLAGWGLLILAAARVRPF